MGAGHYHSEFHLEDGDGLSGVGVAAAAAVSAAAARAWAMAAKEQRRKQRVSGDSEGRPVQQKASSKAGFKLIVATNRGELKTPQSVNLRAAVF